MDEEGSGCSIFESSCLAFIWKDLGNIRKASGRLTRTTVQIRTWYRNIRNMSHTASRRGKA